jgi:heme O synthase-like polyprenyltransferase
VSLAKTGQAGMVSVTTYVVPPFEHQPILYILFGVIAAVVLYLCRLHFQLIYGLIEIIVGLFLMVLSLKVTGGDFSNDFSNDFDTFHYAVIITTYFGAIFVMVRGLDNIRQGWTTRRFRRPNFLKPR